MTVSPEPAVVVGVDGTPASAVALSWAAAEAAVHGAPLVVVHALDPRTTAAVYAAPDSSRDSAVYAGLMREIRELADFSEAAPVEQVFEVGVPARVLTQHARGALILVLGHSAHHIRDDCEEEYCPQEPELGAVARACMAAADCPVVIVPEPIEHVPQAEAESPGRGATVHGGRALYPYQGRIRIAHG